ncbi:MAG TPA: multiheme c-type cytochrome [Candidatus Limnocylindrales bacterium]|nr:multiheme c-type cytochrome [Candidatus Limnocylindrales bacterium]
MDSGDFFGVTGEQDSLKSAFMVQAMDRLGYSVATIGERELSFGQAFLIDTFKKTKIDLVSANVVFADTKKPLVRPYVIRRVGTVRVAFTGFLGKEMPLKRHAGDKELTVLEAADVAKTLIPELRKKADVVVVLSHLGLTDSQKLTIEVPGIDVMVFGHLVGLSKEVVQTQGVINVRGGERGQYIPSIHLVVEDGKIASYDGDVVTLDDKIPADDSMNHLVDNFQDELNTRFQKQSEQAANQEARQTQVALSADHYMGEKNCRRCHEAEYQMYTSQKHAHAFATLTKNQRDSTPECLPCHVVGMGQAGGFVSKESTPDLVNVQCENCHGMGTMHGSGHVVGPEVCITCHTASQDPTFNFDEKLPKIVHWQ